MICEEMGNKGFPVLPNKKKTLKLMAKLSCFLRLWVTAIDNEIAKTNILHHDFVVEKNAELNVNGTNQSI